MNNIRLANERDGKGKRNWRRGSRIEDGKQGVWKREGAGAKRNILLKGAPLRGGELRIHRQGDLKNVEKKKERKARREKTHSVRG